MQIILLEKIDNLGNLGDLVEVKPGFARNFLVPHGKAKTATDANIAEINERRAELEKIQGEALVVANSRAEAFSGKKIIVTSLAGNEGKLFGSISTDQIVKAISEQLGTEVERREIRLTEGPLRSVGEFEIGLHLHADVNTTVIVEVVAEDE